MGMYLFAIVRDALCVLCTYLRETSACCSFQLIRALRRPLTVGASTKYGSHASFLIKTLKAKEEGPEAPIIYMLRFIKLSVCAMVLALVSSCSSTKQTAPVMAIGGNNIITSVKADLDYEHTKKIKGSATNHRVLWIFSHTPGGSKSIKSNNRYKGLNKTEATALYRAKNASEVDVILEPEFETVTKSYFFGIYKKVEVMMSGWGANIKGFKDATPEVNATVDFNGGLFK